MTTHVRPDRVGHEIHAAVASLITRGELRDPRIGFITITGVKVSPDLRVAKVFYSTLASAEERKSVQRGSKRQRASSAAKSPPASSCESPPKYTLSSTSL